MKKFKPSVILLLAFIFLASAVKTIAQTDWSDYKIVAPQKFRFDPSLSDNFYHNAEPDLLVVMTVGAFDNYRITTNGFCETDCAVNPRNPLNFLSCDNNVQLNTGNYWTTDGGASSWNLGTGIIGNQGDGVVAFDSLGNCYLAVLNNGCRVFKSTNNGTTWSNQYTIVTNANADKEWIACDQTSGTFKNNVYMAYVNFATGASVDFWRSTDNGVTWTGPQTLGNGSPNPGPDVETGPNGEVYVMWYGGNGTYTKKSTDGGATFGPLIIASNHSQPGSIGAGGRYVLKNNIRVNGMPHFAVDMSGGPNRGNIYVTFCTNPAGPDKADVYMTRSTDGGATYNTGTPLRANDDATTYDQFMNDVSVDAQGRVWVMWYDSRNDTANINIELYAAVSTDGGVSFMPNIKVSNAPFNANVAAISQGSDAKYIGDYQGIAGKNFTMPVWMDNRANLHPNYTAYLPDFGMLLDKNCDTLNPSGQTISHKISMPIMGPYSGTVTLTSSITPSPAPGTINVTFTPGNVRNFTGNADSVTVNITTSANIPDNYYYLSITGTETSGPRTHTRIDTLLITHFIGIHGTSSEVPKTFALYQNYPNPFNPSTKIEYALPKNAFVTLKVYDVLGREVADLIKGENKVAGFYELNFDASNLPSGIYFYKLSAGDYNEVMKMVLLK